ncbi:MAG: cupin domain-containing protein [Flammeovirgaceae bacterium]
MKSANYWIEKLGLTKHPEGGYFKEVYRSNETMKQESLPARYTGDRAFSTSIYFLLTGNEISAFHRLQSDEIWHYHTGSSATVYEIDQATGKLISHQIGAELESGQRFQVMIKAGNWFAAHLNEPDAYILVGCTVAPGFDFTDFELATEEQLLTAYPQHEELIKAFTI